MHGVFKCAPRPANHNIRSLREDDRASTQLRRSWRIVVAAGLISIALIALWTAPSEAEGRGTRVKAGEATRVFVMAGFTPDCAFKGYPAIEVHQPPSKGTVETSDGAETTVQYSLSGNCIGAAIKGTAIYYKPAPGQTGEDTFSITGRLGNGEPATRTFSVIIDENGMAE